MFISFGFLFLPALLSWSKPVSSQGADDSEGMRLYRSAYVIFPLLSHIWLPPSPLTNPCHSFPCLKIFLWVISDFPSKAWNNTYLSIMHSLVHSFVFFFLSLSFFLSFFRSSVLSFIHSFIFITFIYLRSYLITAPHHIRPDMLVQVRAHVFRLDYETLTIRTSITREDVELTSASETFLQPSALMLQMRVRNKPKSSFFFFSDVTYLKITDVPDYRLN